jgi:hypothetical protein
MLLKVDLESGQAETLVAMIRKPYLASSSPAVDWRSKTGLIAYVKYDEELSRDIFEILDSEKAEKGQVYAEDSVTGFRWNTAGSKLAFLTAESKLGIYSVAEKRVVKIAQLKGYDLRWPSRGFCWTQDDQIVLRKLQGEISYLCILDDNLTEQKTIRLPHASYYPNRIWSVGNYIVVEDTERQQLWGVDLETEKWLRIY